MHKTKVAHNCSEPCCLTDMCSHILPRPIEKKSGVAHTLLQTAASAAICASSGHQLHRLARLLANGSGQLQQHMKSDNTDIV